MNKTPIQRVCEILGSQRAVSDALKVAPATVNQWVSGVRPIPLRRCQAIESATAGAVTRRDLRKDDWWLIWPELVTDEFPIKKRIEAD